MIYRLVATLFALLLSMPAQAYLVSASTSWGIGTGASTSTPRDDFDLQSHNIPPSTPAPATSSTSNTLTFDAFSTVYTTASTARATETELGVSTSFSLTDFNTGINGQINQGAQARFRNTFSIDTLSFVYMLPIFDLNGTLSATPGIDLALSMSVIINTVTVPRTTEIFSLVDEAAPLDGSVLTINENVAPSTGYAAPAGSTIQVDVGLSAQIENLQLSGLTNGASYSALADFDSTSTFLGFAVFEDAAMTIPVTSGVSITSSSTGASIPVINPVPIPAAVWLFGSGLIGLIGVARRKRI